MDFQCWHLSGLCLSPEGVFDHFQRREGTVLPAWAAKLLSLGPPLLQGWMAAARVRTWEEGWGQEQDAKALFLSSLTVSPLVPCWCGLQCPNPAVAQAVAAPERC